MKNPLNLSKTSVDRRGFVQYGIYATLQLWVRGCWRRAHLSWLKWAATRFVLPFCTVFHQVGRAFEYAAQAPTGMQGGHSAMLHQRGVVRPETGVQRHGKESILVFAVMTQPVTCDRHQTIPDRERLGSCSMDTVAWRFRRGQVARNRRSDSGGQSGPLLGAIRADLIGNRIRPRERPDARSRTTNGVTRPISRQPAVPLGDRPPGENHTMNRILSRIIVDLCIGSAFVLTD
jgi:hypothetical protein